MRTIFPQYPILLAPLTRQILDLRSALRNGHVPRVPTHLLSRGWKTRLSLSRLCLWTTVLLLFIVGVPSSLSQSFTAKGLISRTVHSRGTAKHNPQDGYEFDLTVSGCLWKIRVVRVGGPYDYVESGTDGTNVYTVVNMASEVARKRASGEEVGANNAVGYVLPGNIPREADNYAIPILWLAYASACFFETNRSEQIPALFPSGNRNPYSMSALRAATWELSPSTPGLPTAITSLEDGTIDWWENPVLGPWVMKPKKAKLPAPYDGGFTNFLFKVGALTNSSGIVIPTAFQVVRYMPDFGATTSVLLRTNVSIVGRLSTVETARESAVTLPEIPGKTLCADYRFALAAEPVLESVTYLFEGRWLTDDEVRKTPAYLEQLASGNRAIQIAGSARLRDERASSPTARLWIISALVLSLIVPVAWIARNRIGKQKKGNRTT